MTLNPEIKNFLDNFNKLVIPALQSIEAERESYLHFAHYNSGWPLKLARVEDAHILSQDKFQIPIRIYTPQLNTQLPCLIYYHGGGWRKGDIATHDSICRHLAFYSNCIIISVNWRLAPEHLFPVGIDDALTAYQWVLDYGTQYNIECRRIGLGGDSAGGNITAAVFKKINDAGIQLPIFQLLLYASLDLRCQGESYKLFSNNYFLTTSQVKNFIQTYLPSLNDIHNPLASPILQDDLRYLPPTHIVYAGYDPLRNDSESYIDKLKVHNVKVTSKCYTDMIHGFLHMNHSVPIVNDALQEIGHTIKQALHAS